MSTYTNRFIEVKVLDCDRHYYRFDILQKHIKDLIPGKHYQVTGADYKYYVKKHTDDTVLVGTNECPSEWKLVKYYKEYVKEDHSIYKDGKFDGYEEAPIKTNGLELEPVYSWCDNGGYIRDNVISSRAWEDNGLNDRGLPSDISKETSEHIYTNGWDYTWINITELEQLLDKKIEEFKHSLTEAIYENKLAEINTKLDCLLNKTKYKETNDDDRDIKEEYYLWDEDFLDILTISREIAIIKQIAESCPDFYYYHDLRIIYYLD